MNPTLSQAFAASFLHPNRPGSSTRDATRLSCASLLLAIVLAVTGCNRVESDRASETQESPAAGSNVADGTKSSDSTQGFAWPDGEDHPRLRIAVDDGTMRGTIEIELMPELAPLTLLRISDLAANGYYDGTTFHRVIDGFMIQGGDPNSRDRDPNNDGYGDSDLRMDDEFSAAPFERGVVGMANTGRPNSNDGQFFIMHADQHELTGRYTAIGRVVSGMDVVDAITRVEIDRSGRWGPKDRPIENVVMTEVTIGQSVAAAAAGPQGTAEGNSDD